VHEGPKEGYATDGSKWHRVFWRKSLSFDDRPFLVCIAKCKALNLEDEQGQIIFGEGRSLIGTPQIFAAPLDSNTVCEDCNDPSKCPPLCPVCSDPMCVNGHPT